ncbi:alanine racemase [Candidatus Fermentibacterales bacterium]|nr:alanine racemase [Candidatus Fermentibacterales bacterium]
MNRLLIGMDALGHNYRTVGTWIGHHGAALTVVTKALCGHEQVLGSLARIGATSVADSRLENLRVISDMGLELECWYLRPPHSSELEEVVRLADVSLNTELSTVKDLDSAAGRLGYRHKVLLMIELGDLREGILPGALVRTYQEVFTLPNVDIIGIGANLGCLAGAIPSIDQLMQLVLYRELLELKFDRKLPFISAGSSAVLPLLLEGQVPPAVNHFRVGEAILLGTDLINGGTLGGLRNDGFLLEAEVVEVKEKSLTPLGETSDEISPFGTGNGSDPDIAPGSRGFRAVVTVGELDTDVSSLVPVNPEYRIAGASSDVTVLNVGEHGSSLSVGDTVSFRMGYSGLVRLMNNRYTEKVIVD